MADFDFSSLLQNPLFMSGIGLLGNKGNNVAGNFAQGMQSAQQAQLFPLQKQLLALQAQRAQNAMNFNPADFMQTTPGLLGQSGQAQQDTATQTPQTMPAGLGGPIGSQTQIPSGAPTAAGFSPVGLNGQGAPTGMIDLPGLMTAGLKAGFSPQDMGMLAQGMAPAYYARLQAMTKMFEPMNVAPGGQVIVPAMAGQGAGGVVGSNTNAPPMSQLGQLDALTKARDQYPVGSPQYQSLDAAVQKMNGTFDQKMQQERLDELKSQRDIANSFRQTTITNQQNQRNFENQQKLQGQVQDLSERLDKSGYSDLQQSINDFNSWTKQNPNLPGFGRVEGALPDWAVSDAGKTGRQLFARMQNIQLHSLFGARTTDSEVQRDIRQLGTGFAMPAQNVLTGVQGLQNNLNAKVNTVAQGEKPETIKEFNRRGLSPILLPEVAGTPEGASGPTSGPGSPTGGGSAPISTNPQEAARARLHAMGVPGY